MLALLALSLALADEPFSLEAEPWPSSGEPMPVEVEVQPVKPAPTLSVSHWVARGPIDLADPDVFYVVEVWATWCQPCHESFPLLSAVQEQYGERIRVIGLTDERPARVRAFYDQHRDAMRYAVASEPEAVTMKALMFGGYSGSGMPSAYVIRGGQVLWSGAPAGLPTALSALLAPADRSPLPGGP